MEPRLVSLILASIVVDLSCLTGYWQRKTGDAAFAAALSVDTASCHVMFMPCSNWIKYGQRFKRLE